MKEIYEMKQTQWKLEDIQRENEQLLQKQRKKETRQFLNQIKKRPRFIQQYVDSYSHREEKINKEIVQLHSILGKKFYDKRKLNRKIDEFINELEHKENERRASDPEWRNAKENEVNLQDEVAEMIKRNLNSQSSDEEEVQIGKGEVNESFVLMSPGSNGKEYEDFLEFKSNVLEKEHERVVRDKERQDSQIDLIRRQSEPKLSRLSSLIFGVIEKRNNSKRNTVNTGDVLRNNLNFVRRRSTLNSDPLAQLGLENKPLGVKKTLSRTNTMLINITTNILKENNRNDAVNVEQD